MMHCHDAVRGDSPGAAGPRIWHRSALLIAAVVLHACSPEQAAVSPPRPVLQAVVVADTDEHHALLAWSERPDDDVTPDPSASVPEAALIARFPDGSLVQLAPVAGRPGELSFAGQVGPGDAVTLEGTVAGLAVRASAVVPGPLEVTQPAGDTLVVRRDACGLSCEVDVAWRAEGSAVLEVLQVAGEGEDAALRGTRLLRAPAGRVALVASSGVERLLFVAHDAASDAFLFTEPARGNLGDAVLGFVGARAVVEKVLVWE